MLSFQATRKLIKLLLWKYNPGPYFWAPIVSRTFAFNLSVSSVWQENNCVSDIEARLGSDLTAWSYWLWKAVEPPEYWGIVFTQHFSGTSQTYRLLKLLLRNRVPQLTKKHSLPKYSHLPSGENWSLSNMVIHRTSWYRSLMKNWQLKFHLGFRVSCRVLVV